MKYSRIQKVNLTWTPELLANFTSKQLLALYTYEPGVSVPLTPDLMKFFSAYPPSEDDREAAFSLSTKKRRGAVLAVATLEETAVSMGHVVRYTEDTISVVKPSGEVKSFANAVVPMATATKPRPGQSAIVALVGSLFKSNGGVIQPTVPPRTLEEHWGDDGSCFRPVGMTKFQGFIADFITDSVKWKSMLPTQKDSLTGPRWLVWLAEFFAGIPWADYFVLHTEAAVNLLKIVKRRGPSWVRWKKIVGDRRVDHVPSSSLTILTKAVCAPFSDEVREAAKVARRTVGMDPIILIGPFPGVHAFVGVSEREAPLDLTRAIKASKVGDLLRGGKRSGFNVLAGCVGFSGLPTEQVQHWTLQASTIIGLSQVVSNLDVFCESVNVIPLMQQTVVNAKALTHSQCVIRFVVSYDNFSKVEVTCRPVTLTAYRPTAHRLWISTKTMESLSSVTDLLAKSGEHLATLENEHGFTFYGPAFGPAPFANGRHLYVHGWPVDFCAFVTTLPAFCLAGVTVRDGAWDSLVNTPLREMPDYLTWYREVITANFKSNAYFLRPQRNYSPISNLLSAPTKGVVFVQRGDEMVPLETGDDYQFVDPAHSDEDEYGYSDEGDDDDEIIGGDDDGGGGDEDDVDDDDDGDGGGGSPDSSAIEPPLPPQPKSILRRIAPSLPTTATSTPVAASTVPVVSFAPSQEKTPPPTAPVNEASVHDDSEPEVRRVRAVPSPPLRPESSSERSKGKKKGGTGDAEGGGYALIDPDAF